MIAKTKMIYRAPETVLTVLEAENSICGTSTSERFGNPVSYGSDWEEED